MPHFLGQLFSFRVRFLRYQIRMQKILRNFVTKSRQKIWHLRDANRKIALWQIKCFHIFFFVFSENTLFQKNSTNFKNTLAFDFNVKCLKMTQTLNFISMKQLKIIFHLAIDVQNFQNLRKFPNLGTFPSDLFESMTLRLPFFVKIIVQAFVFYKYVFYFFLFFKNWVF